MVAEALAGAAPGAAAASRTRFYLWMAVAMAATAFIGFAPTFWAPMAQGVPEKIGVLAVHGILFFGWTLFVIYQAWRPAMSAATATSVSSACRWRPPW